MGATIQPTTRTLLSRLLEKLLLYGKIQNKTSHVYKLIYGRCQDPFSSDLISCNYPELTGLQPHSLLADPQTLQAGPLLCSHGLGFSSSRCYKRLSQLHLGLCLMLSHWRGSLYSKISTLYHSSSPTLLYFSPKHLPPSDVLHNYFSFYCLSS